MKHRFLLFCLIFLRVFIANFPVQGAEDVRSWSAAIGVGAEFETINAALKAIPVNASDVTLRIQSTLADAQQDTIISIPILEHLKSVSFEADRSQTDEERPFRADSVYTIYANGIPLSISAGIEFPNASVFGGSSAAGEALSSVESTQLSISGKVANVYGGGHAADGGSAIVTGSASVRIEEGGEVYWKVCGGGLAEGAGSVASVAETRVTVAGTVSYGFGGGAAELGAQSEVITQSTLDLSASGYASVALFGGGIASDMGSRYESADTNIRIAGEAAWVFGGDYAFAGGSVELSGVAVSEILPGAVVSELYAGSFAIDADSVASIAAARVIGGDLAVKYAPTSIASKNAAVSQPVMQDSHE